MPKCPVCETKVDRVMEKYISPFNNVEYKLYHCRDCYLQWWEPLRIIPELYEKEYLDLYKIFHSGVRKLSICHKPFFKYFPHFNGRLLDVGCGDGIFLSEAQKLGFEVWGIDFDKKSINVAREKHGLKNTYTMSLDEFVSFTKRNNLKFDIITFFETLEHQDNPRNFMENIISLLKTGGYIAGSVPNRERLFAQRDRKVFKVDYPPHHFLYFNQKSLQNLLSKYGFNKMFFAPTQKNLIEFSAYMNDLILGNLSKSLKKIIKENFIKEPNLSINQYEKLYGKNWKTHLLQGLKVIRTLVFLPLALILIYPFNEKGYQIYFHAKLEND